MSQTSVTEELGQGSTKTLLAENVGHEAKGAHDISGNHPKLHGDDDEEEEEEEAAEGQPDAGDAPDEEIKAQPPENAASEATIASNPPPPTTDAAKTAAAVAGNQEQVDQEEKEAAKDASASHGDDDKGDDDAQVDDKEEKDEADEKDRKLDDGTDKQDKIDDRELPPEAPPPEVKKPSAAAPPVPAAKPAAKPSKGDDSNKKPSGGKYKCMSTSKSRRLAIEPYLKISANITNKYGPCVPRMAAQIAMQLRPFLQRGIHVEDIQLAFQELQYQERSLLIRKAGSTLQLLMPSAKENDVVNGVGHRIATTLATALSQVSIPNFELVLRLGYRPVAPKSLNFFPRVGRRHEFTKPMPVFGLATTDAHWDINWPNNMLPKVKNWTQLDVPWASKQPKAVWRGTTKGLHAWMDDPSEGLAVSPRGAVALAAQSDPDIIDAGFTDILPDHRYVENRVAKKAAMEYQDQLRYKALVVVDGMGFIGHYRTFMATNSGTLKVKSPLYEFWYPGLTQYWNAFEADVEDTSVRDAVRWILSHDEDAHRIAQRAKDYVKRAMSEKFVQCYLWRLLAKYGELMRYDPKGQASVLGKVWTNAGDTVTVHFDKAPNDVQFELVEAQLTSPSQAAQDLFKKKCRNVLALGKPLH